MKSKSFVRIVTIFLLILVVNGCSSESEMGNKARSTIIGKWKLVKNGPNDKTADNEFIQFNNKSRVKYEYHVGEDAYHFIESNYKLAKDWSYDDETDELTGHVYFKLWESGHPENKEDKYICSFKEDQMMIIPDMGDRYIRDPTMYFVRVP